METKQFPFSKQDILNELNGKWNNNSVSVDYGECRQGCGSNSTHKFYFVRLNWTEFQDNGQYRTQYQFVRAVQNELAKYEQELAKKDIVFKKVEQSFEHGVSGYWGSVEYEKTLAVNDIITLRVCKSFKDLQKWLKAKADFDLGLTDLYQCQLCQKRSSKSYSQFEYLAENERKCALLLEKIKSAYKSGYNVVVEKVVNEDFDDYDRNHYEYEQYGYKIASLKITISTPTGRNPQIIKTF